MPYKYLDDIAIADAAFEAWGADLEEVFRAAADAALGVMVEDPQALFPGERIELDTVERSLDLLLFRLLEEIVFHKDAARLLLRCTQCAIAEAEAGWELKAVLEGEQIDESRQVLLLDVKAVTLHMLSVERSGDGWRARVGLDV